jgi:hypothetical protein
MIELFLSSDGKHTVHIAAETPVELAKLAPSARSLYQKVLEVYGTKAQMWQEVTGAKGNGEVKTSPQTGALEGALEANPPRCPVHGRAMVQRQGRFGAFWSCPTRQFNGSWCQVTREISTPGDGQQAE